MLSAAELTKRLKEAAEAVDQAGLSEDLRPIGFQRSLDALGVGAVNVPISPSQVGAPNGGGGDEGGEPQDEGHALPMIAKRLDVDQALIRNVFEEEEEGQIRLIIKRAMLPEPDRKAASMRQVALLVVAGRQAAGIEEYTAYDSIREECRELKVYDGPNFATEVGKLEFRTRGGRNSKEARANRHHFDDAAELVRQMTQGA
jgi:hypothetical protein